MIPQISKALSSGFTQKQILDFLMKKFPEHRERIQSALATGFTVNQILSFLSGGKKALNQMSMEDNEPTTDFEKTRAKDIQQREDINKGALELGALAATSLAAPMAAKALQRALPSSLTSMTPSLTATLQQQTQQQLPQQPPSGLNNATSVTQPQTNAQSEIKPLDLAPFKSKYKGFFDKIDDLKNAGNDTNAIVGYFRKFKPTEILQLEKEVGKPFEEIVDEYAQETSQQPQEQASIQPSSEKLDVSQEAVERKKPSKSETVATPHGVGEIREIRNGQAIVDVDGKLHKVKEGDLESSPLPEKDLADLYDELIQGIESETGEDVSRMVQWAGYNPETNTLQFLPHTGKLYKYNNISPEDAALLRDILSVRKTSGENFIGAWKAGSHSPIGAALSKLIRKLQAERGGKGNEYEETHEPIYSAYEPAIQAKKKKKKR